MWWLFGLSVDCAESVSQLCLPTETAVQRRRGRRCAGRAGLSVSRQCPEKLRGEIQFHKMRYRHDTAFLLCLLTPRGELSIAQHQPFIIIHSSTKSNLDKLWD